jgi:D-alanyl-D-alanine dipeptidase
MTSEAYCKSVEEKEQLRKSLVSSIAIHENYSSLVPLKKPASKLIFEPAILVDYTYPIRQEVAGKISRINRVLNKQGKILMIRSAWHSEAEQVSIRQDRLCTLKTEFPNQSTDELEELAARFYSPKEESMDKTGGAIEALICDGKTNQVLDFGNNIGSKIALSDYCYPYHPDISSIGKTNRKLLIDVFDYEGFTLDHRKYWHFDYGNVNWAIQMEKKTAKYGVSKA